MSFTEIVNELQKTLKRELAQIQYLLKKNPAMAYTRIIEIGGIVGKKYNLKLIVNFPHEGKINEFDKYGKRDLSLIMDQTKTRFPIERVEIKNKASTLFENSEIQDAYMYEGKEGVRVLFVGGRIDILPHSLHIWCEFTPSVIEFCDWLMYKVYLR